MGTWASQALTTTDDHTLRGRMTEYWLYAKFRAAMLTLDVAFWVTRLRGWVQVRLGSTREGFEDEIERRMRGIAKQNLGYDIGPGAFQG
jgi:aarF domain-containing kinase